MNNETEIRARLAKLYIVLIQNDAKPSVTSSVTIESTTPVNTAPVVVTAPLASVTSIEGDLKK